MRDWLDDIWGRGIATAFPGGQGVVISLVVPQPEPWLVAHTRHDAVHGV